MTRKFEILFFQPRSTSVPYDNIINRRFLTLPDSSKLAIRSNQRPRNYGFHIEISNQSYN